MESTTNFGQYIPLLIIALTVISSITGFGNGAFFERYKFNVGAILGGKQYDRLLSSSFLHGDYLHLIFNMMTLFFFSDIIIMYVGVWQYMVIYFASIVGGGLLSLWMHRKEYYYSAIGASGGVVGILFASIALDPHIGIYMFFIPIPIPGWIFGVLYLFYSVYSMQRGGGMVGHDAHLGGAAMGLILMMVFMPEALQHNWLYIMFMVIPLIVLGYIAWKKKD